MPKAVIMAGGQGERFWPLTHKKFPKYRIQLDGRYSLLQKTYKRLLGVYQKNDIYVVTTQEHREIIRKELKNIESSRILIEPCRKNTAPAILLSCLKIQEEFGPSEVVSFFPADHLIENETSFQDTLKTAIRLATGSDSLVMIGIEPTFPATGYGYIESGQKIKNESLAHRVASFREKPNRAVAERYLKSKRYLWNGGIFSWKAGVLIGLLRTHSPQLVNGLRLNALKDSYAKLPSISIDYALLEKTKSLTVVRTSMDWCDMGSWDMFLEKARVDSDQNWVMGPCQQKESKASLLLNYTQEPPVAHGLNHMIVVKSERGVLICRRTRSEEAALLAKQC